MHHVTHVRIRLTTSPPSPSPLHCFPSQAESLILFFSYFILFFYLEMLQVVASLPHDVVSATPMDAASPTRVPPSHTSSRASPMRAVSPLQPPHHQTARHRAGSRTPPHKPYRQHVTAALHKPRGSLTSPRKSRGHS